MQIAVDARFLQEDETRGSGDFTAEVFFRLAAQYPQHRFFFLSDKTELLQKSPENISYLKITPQTTNAILLKWWFDVKVPLALKKIKADVFVCPNGVCSLTSKVPQVLMVPALSIARHSVFYRRLNPYFHKKYVAAFIKKAAAIGVVSPLIKQEIIDLYKIPAEKITVTGIAASDFFEAVSWQEKEEIKEKFSEGCEYFIFNTISSSAENVVKTLKAFSIFKKWQKTNMKLILAGATYSTFKNEREKLSNYKYKNDVVVTDLLPKQELAKLVAGAYAAIFFETDIASPVIEAMQCHVPVIIAGNKSLAEVAGEAALLAQSAKPEEIAAQMKQVFKDEQLRSELAEKAKIRAENFSWNKTADLTWQLIEKSFYR